LKKGEEGDRMEEREDGKEKEEEDGKIE